MIGDICKAFIISYQPKLIDGLSLGFIRWVQMYSALVEGKYWWMNGSIPHIFQHLKIYLEKMINMKILKHKLIKLRDFIYEMVLERF